MPDNFAPSKGDVLRLSFKTATPANDWFANVAIRPESCSDWTVHYS